MATVDPATGGTLIKQVNLPAFPETWKLQDGVPAQTTRSTKHGTANVVFETADTSAFCVYDTLMLVDSSADPIVATLQLRPGSKGVLILSGLTGSTATLVGVISGVVTSAIEVYPVGNNTLQTAMGNGSFRLGMDG